MSARTRPSTGLGRHARRRGAAGLRPDAGDLAAGDRLRQSGADIGMAARHRIPLRRVSRLTTDARKKGDDDPQKDKLEPFGFVDGVSQPVIRGTYKGLRDADPIHLVEPGEFILGYPDNRGNMPPGPTLAATRDPENILPIVAGSGDISRTVVEDQRDLGCNGSFLVIRQLEQDVDGFWNYCGSEAARLADRLPPPYVVVKRIHRRQVDRTMDGRLVAGALSLSSAGSEEKERAVQLSHASRGRDGTARHRRAEPLTATKRPPKQCRREPLPRSRKRTDRRPIRAAVPTTTSCSAPRTRKGCAVRSAPISAAPTRARASIQAQRNRSRSQTVTALCGSDGLSGAEPNPGLLFMCLNGDIERQFEFIQQTWLRRPSFHGLSCEKDPVLGDGETGACCFTIPSRERAHCVLSRCRASSRRWAAVFLPAGQAADRIFVRAAMTARSIPAQPLRAG